MRQVAVAVLLGLIVACGGDDAHPPVDGGAHDAVAHDAGRVNLDAAVEAMSGELDLRSLVIATLIETEGSLVARCPCYVASGMYASMRACEDAVSFDRNWLDCANSLDLSTQEDSPELRQQLRCNIEEQKQRGQCLMGSGCSNDDVVACMTASLDCGGLPVELFSQFAAHCQIAFSR